MWVRLRRLLSEPSEGGPAMKALALSSFDDKPSVMDVDDPVPGQGEVLVRVAAASINAFDVRVTAGGVRGVMTYTFPAGVGGGLSGHRAAPGGRGHRVSV